MSNIKLIGLSGPMKSGKDTAADFIKRDMTGLLNLPLAGFLKDVCAEVFSIRRSDFDSQDLKATPFDKPKEVNFVHLMHISRLYSARLNTRKLYFMLLHTWNTFEGIEIDTPRKLLQWVGTDFLRKSCPNIHLAVAALDMQEGVEYIITDCRFPNEVKWIQDHGGRVFYIERPEAETAMFESTHQSERGIADLRFKCDYMVQNRGSLEEFQINLREALRITDAGISK